MPVTGLVMLDKVRLTYVRMVDRYIIFSRSTSSTGWKPLV